MYLTIEYKFSKQPTRNRLGHPLLDLLDSLKDHGSIGEAAKHLGRSYRHVWGELKFWEGELNANLIVWGRSGKAAALTPEAIQYLEAMSLSQKRLAQDILNIKKQVLKNTQLIMRSK